MSYGGSAICAGHQRVITSALASPEDGFPVGLVIYSRQMRSLQSLTALQSTIDAGDQQAACQQRAFDWILRLAREEHLLGVMRQRAEVTRDRGARSHIGEKHQRREGF